jgi:thiamine biosynthesis lipoprotein
MTLAAKTKVLWFFALFFASACNGTSSPPETSTLMLTGSTMGTTWHATIRGRPGQELPPAGRMQAQIQGALDEVDRTMSTYKADSDLSRFNRAKVNQVIPLNPLTADLLRFGLDLAEKSAGAFDPTVMPLVNAWSFGPAQRKDEAPSTEEILGLLEVVGWQKIHWNADQSGISKSSAGVALDFSAFAKGFGVDQVHQVLLDTHLKNFLIEVGGELRTQGEKSPGVAWAVGVERPADYSGFGTDLEMVLPLHNQAIATSGDYRNFRMLEGKRIFHILDPRTGYPAASGIASVTVVAANSMTADALATTLSVLKPALGMDLLEKHFPQAQAMFILRQADGFKTLRTDRFPEPRL